MPCFAPCPLPDYKTVSIVDGKTKVVTRTDIQLPSYACKKESPYKMCRDVFYTQAITPKVKHRFKQERKVTLPNQEYNRLKTAAKVVTLDDRLDALVKQEQEAKRLEDQATRAKQYFKDIDDARKREEEEKHRGIESQEPDEKLKVLERAFLAKHEQEEEVKRANRVILDIKCHAVRDAQIQEKNELHRELRKDEQRLDKIVIDRAIKELREEDEKNERLHEEKQKYAKEIKKQLNERATARFLEAERVEEEAVMIRKANEVLKSEEERQKQLNWEKRCRYRDDLAKVMEMSTTFRRLLCEQEKESEMRIAAYMRDREERLRILKAEEKLAKEEMERKRQRIYNLAEKILQSKSDREEMAYLREQERMEREYRKKEKEAILRKKQVEKDLADARERQMQEVKHRQALQIARAEQEFNTLINQLKEAEAKQRREDDERERRRQCYRRDIVQQMGNNEMRRRQLQELERNRAAAWRESERQRDLNIRAVINAKLNAMRDACLPDKYIKDVEKQLSKIIGKNKPIPKLTGNF